MKPEAILYILGGIVLIYAVLTIEPANISPKTNSDRNITEEQQVDDARTDEDIKEDVVDTLRDVEKQVSELQEDINEYTQKQNQSKYFDLISIIQIQNPSQYNPAKEYVKISVSKSLESPVSVTGWTLKSRYTGKSIEIGQGTNLYRSNGSSVVSDIILNKGDIAYVTTAKSPINYSFRINICSGYHEQDHDFSPSISKMCPSAYDDMINIPLTPQNETCYDYIRKIPRCETHVGSIPYAFTGECNEYIYQKINYPSCLEKHIIDENFYDNEWRIYLGQNSTLWRDKNEIIDLIDNEGKIVDTYTN